MKHIITALALSLAASTALADEAGLRVAQIPMPHFDTEARVVIWYPRGAGGAPILYGDNPVFNGVEAYLDADPSQGRFPVVMFSHGMGGTDRAQAWLGAGLARRGAVVVMVNHPNSTWGNFNMAEGVQHWTRAADLSSALDWLQDDPDLAPHLDDTRILAAGFSYGGWTALSLGGMTGNLGGLVAACTTHIETMEACDMVLSDDVGLQRQDATAWNASYADARVTSVVAIDPGFVWGLGRENVAALLPDALLIGLGDPETQMLATDFTASGLSALLAQGQTQHLAPAFHFTAMPLCKPDGAAILEAEHDDPVCTDPAGTDRADVHGAILDAIAARLGL